MTDNEVSISGYEKWLPVVDYEGIYEVSDFGRVRSLRSGHGTFVGRILKPYLANTGYPVINLYKEGQHCQVLVHRLVSASFMGLCPSGLQVNHLDGNKSNNISGNLEYVTQSENNHHAYRMRLRVPPCLIGEKNGFAKLTEDNIRAIRRLLGVETQTVIAERFGVKQVTISDIARKRTWGWLVEETA